MATAIPKESACNLVKIEPLKLEKDNLFVIALVVSGDFLIVTDRNSWKVLLYRHWDRKLLATTDRMESEPRGICFINNMEICVTVGNKIEIMSVQCTGDTGAITRCRTLHQNTTFDYFSRVVKSMDKVVVCGRHKEYMICWFTVSLDGPHLDTVHHVSKGLWSYMTAKHNMIYISCRANRDSPDNGVYGYDIDNPSKQAFICKHKNLTWPTGITVDTMGFVFVGNYFPSCVNLLTNKCELVTVFREGMPRNRLCDLFWDHGLLYVTREWSKVVNRYKTEYPLQGDHEASQVLGTQQITETEGAIDEMSSETEEEVLPPEILNMDESFQKLYREVLATGKEKVYNIRVMIVGNQGVGKTSLTQRFLGQQVEEIETESTEGIEVHAQCCQIDHATRKWKRKIKTDELFLNDQRIASLLHKYTSPQTNQDIKETDPENDISPAKEQRLPLHSETTVLSPVHGDPGSFHNEADGDIAASQIDKTGQTGNGLDEPERMIYPKEIQTFVERVQSLPFPKSRTSDVTLLDFAGQTVFYTTHQAFMSWRTLYLLVTDMSLPLTDVVEENVLSDVSGTRIYRIQDYITNWLNSVHSHVLRPGDDWMRREGKGGGVQASTMNHPFVILVGTHSDKIPKELLDQKKRTYFNDIRIFLKNSPLLVHLVDEDFAISNLGLDPNINALKSKIFDVAQKQVYWGEEIPARWIPLERALTELKNKGVPVMDYDDVKSLNENLQVRIELQEELDLFLRFEHDIGNIVFFNTERLRKKVVLNPQWLIHGVRTWITSDQVLKKHPELTEQWNAFKNTGQLTSTLLEKLWSSHSEFHQHKEHLLDVMEELNIIVKPLQIEKEYFYWLPCMVRMLLPDDMKKLQQNTDRTKTSTLCFRSKTNFIHAGVFHRLLATCLSKWAPAKEGNSYVLYQGYCVFDLDEQQQLLLSLNDFVIHATVIRFTTQGRIPDLPLCMTIWDYLYTALSKISDCLCPGSEFEICIKCKESSPLTNEGLHSITTLRTKDELRCSTHKEAHCVESRKLLGFWEDKTQIPVNVLPQHSTLPSERFTWLSSLVLDVGSQVLRDVLTYCTTDSNCTLDQYMKENEPQILQLWKSKVLTEAQVKIIFPPSGQTDINKYDIILASALLNKIYPQLGQKEVQAIMDLSSQRIELANSQSTKMNEKDFQTKWTEITTILTGLSKLCKDLNIENRVQKEIQNIQQSGSGTMASKMTEVSKRFNRIFKMFEEI